MKIGKAQINELEIIIHLFDKVIVDMNSKSIYQWDEVYPDKNLLNSDISSGNAFVGRFDNKIIGYMVLNNVQNKEYEFIEWSFNNDKVLVLHRLCIHPDYQGKGYANKMLLFAEEYAKNNNYYSIRLDAFIQNKNAIKLYESNNYSFSGKVKFRKGEFNCYEKKII